MSEFLKGLFRPKEEPLTQFGHPRLGLLEFDPEEAVWVVTAREQEREVRFRIGGDSRPDPHLMEQASRVLADYDIFHSEISRFLGLEASARPKLSDEARQLQVTDICFFWPNRPSDAMVFFSQPGSSRVWHCDYLSGRFSSLSYDS